MATLRRRITLTVLVVLVTAGAVFAWALSHETPCGPAPALSTGAPTMKAVVRRCYGPPAVLKLEDVEQPVPKDNELLVKVRAASINPADWHFVRGEPYLIRMDFGLGAPTNPRIGIDFAGTIAAVGKNVTQFRPGDEVFGGKNGALAEYITIAEDGNLARKPAGVDFVQAAAVNVAGLTALQTLRDRAGLKPGQTVLVNGASGGVGSFAVQIAKSLGAEVTGVSSTRNQQLVRSLGADHVIDYTRQDFTQGGLQYDVVMDNVVNHGVLEMRRVLKPEGKLILIGGGGIDASPWFGAFKAPIAALFVSWFVDQDMAMFVSHHSREDLATLARLMEEGKVTPVIDRTYPLAETVEAMTYLETGRARGKVVVVMESAGDSISLNPASSSAAPSLPVGSRPP
jgi:NADPH:quinone reductase-like Zn-dependent oxidoreductase